MKPVGALAAILLLAASSALAANKPPENAPILPGGNSKEPISVEADKLVYFEKELKAVYTGNVIAIQGDSKLTCSMLTIFMEKAPAAPAAAPAKTADAHGAPPKGADAGGEPDGASSRMRHMDCAGPVTMVSKTQTATGDSGSYDKPQNKVLLIGHVTLSDGRNVTKGDRLTYDMTTGEAVIDKEGQHRITGQFLPGGADSASPAKPKVP